MRRAPRQSSLAAGLAALSLLATGASPAGFFRATVSGEVRAELEGPALWFHPVRDSLASHVFYLAAGDSAFLLLDGDFVDLPGTGAHPVAALPARYEPAHPGAFVATLTWLPDAGGAAPGARLYRSLAGEVRVTAVAEREIEARFDLTATADAMDSPRRHAVRIQGEFRAARGR